MEKENEITRIALVDDHILFRTALSSLINKFGNCAVIMEAGSGEELIAAIKSGIAPDLVLLDLNMPEMDGFDTAKWIQANKPEIAILMLTMYNTELTMIRLLQAGVRGFLKKDATPLQLKSAINNVMEFGYYYTNNTTGKLINLFRKSQEQSALMKSMLTETELTFLKYTCSEMTYKEIANEMNLNPRAIDNIRDNLFEKLEVKSRIGLAMYSIKHCIYILQSMILFLMPYMISPAIVFAPTLVFIF
jgi:DNA-binding NarL/FixJ family response regulator